VRTRREGGGGRGGGGEADVDGGGSGTTHPPLCAAWQDSTFEFEKRRNRPVKYDRELMGTTIRAMKRVAEIQKARDERYWKKRMSVAKEGERERAALEVVEGLHLLAPAASKRAEELNALATAKLKEATEAREAAAAAAGGDASGSGGRKRQRRPSKAAALVAAGAGAGAAGAGAGAAGMEED
jgi:large subunit ribosomal protein L24e